MTTRHTPEPWASRFGNPGQPYEVRAGGWTIAKIYGSGETLDESEATRAGNVARIVACVNGCAGIADPEKDIPDLVAQRDALADALRDAEFLMRKLGINPKEATAWRDSLNRSAEDARAALAQVEKEGRAPSARSDPKEGAQQG